MSLARSILVCSLFLCVFGLHQPADAQTKKAGQRKETKKKAKKPDSPFQWVNTPKQLPVGVTHATFRSSSMDLDVGYCIYLPPAYLKSEGSAKRFPVVYYLHGGRPGSELKSVKLATAIHANIVDGSVSDMIYVFVNGGPVSHYNMVERSNAMGADVFIKELLPHIDKTYRTIADRQGRAIEGFSQGGRGTTRIAFRYPELFCSAAPGGAGHATEKRISEEGGRESKNLVFSEGDNTYDLARAYAVKKSPSIALQLHVGTLGFNYENNLAYMKFLDELKIPYTKVIVEGAPHSAAKIYSQSGLAIMRHHAQSFAQPVK
ncbi:MAG: alpha/beta hydrolase-fold protein [Fuerstiella sp.]